MHFSADVLYSYLLSDLEAHVDLTLPGWAPDSTPRQAACLALRDSLLKKFNQGDMPPADACRAALEKFKAVNERCGRWELVLESTYDEFLVNAVKREIENFWYREGVDPLISDYRECFTRGRAGPGASVNARDTDLYTKMFDSPLSSTRGLPEIWERCVVENDLFFAAEAARSYHYPHNVVDHSKYSFVNKTRTVARGICTEPSVNMWLQLGAGAILEDRLKSFFRIDLTVIRIVRSRHSRS
jgi:hypothetical protein